MTRKLWAASALALVMVLATASPVLASVNNISADIVKPDSGHVRCGGKNTVSKTVKTLGVSYVCQRKDNTGRWVDIGVAPASTCSDCTSIGFIYTTIDCGDVGRGTWYIRAQADGWHVHYDGTRHDDPAVATTKTKQLSCP
jgi:hypothetical protein